MDGGQLAAAEAPSQKIDRSLRDSRRSGAWTDRVMITMAPSHVTGNLLHVSNIVSGTNLVLRTNIVWGAAGPR